MKSTILALVIGLAGTGGSVAKAPETAVPAGYVQLTGDATTPYTELCRIAFSQVTLRLPHDQADEINRDVFGEPFEYDPPEIPSTSGPFIYRDKNTNRVIANYCIGAMGYYEMVFLPTKPPTIAGTYFMDAKHKIRFATYAALYRNSAEQMKILFDSLQQQPAKIKDKKDTEQVGGVNAHEPLSHPSATPTKARATP